MAGQLASVPTAGGLLYGNQISPVMRLQVQPLTKFKSYCDGRLAAGKGRGSTFTWDIVSNWQTPGGALVESQTMPITNFVVAQGTLTISEFGNSVAWSGLLEDVAKFDVKSPAGRTARIDAALTLDRAAWAQFNQTLLRVIASGASTSGTDTVSIQSYTNGTVTGTNSVAFTVGHAGSISDYMKGRNIPAYNGGDYFALSNVSTLRNLKSGSVGSTNLQTINQYTESGRALIRNGEIGRYECIRFVEQTNIAPGIGSTGIATGNPAPGGGTGDMVAWTNGKSDWMFIFGADSVVEAVVEPAHIRAQIPGDYGRAKGLAWYYVGGFGIAQGFSTTAGSPGGQLNSRIVKWDSQA